MAEKKSGARTSNSVNVSLRLDPKTKYLIDLLARDQKRTITGVIEWALERAADETSFANSGSSDEGPSFLAVLESLWSTDEALRIVRLALAKPSLLDYGELRVWETIKATTGFWSLAAKNSYQPLNEANLLTSVLQEHWDDLIAHVGRNQNSRSIVPYPLEDKRFPDNFDDFDEEIPY